MADAMPQMQARAAAPKRMMAAATDGSHTEHHLRAATAGHEGGTNGIHADENAVVGGTIDYSSIAKELDHAFDAFDIDSALRPTKLMVEDNNQWEKKFQKTLLHPTEKMFLSHEEKKSEKDKAFDLLDALSKSGAQPIYYSELHVIVAATHRFDYSLIDTVIRSNMNPITSIERSALIVSSTIHDLPVSDLVLGQGRLASVEQNSPGLLDMRKQETNKEMNNEDEATLKKE
jgi:hypothetical protein